MANVLLPNAKFCYQLKLKEIMHKEGGFSKINMKGLRRTC